VATDEIRNLVVVSDLHCGCRAGLCPPDAVQLDGGGTYAAGEGQVMLWAAWREFWDEWVPEVTKGEPFAVVVNGDALDGTHHGSKTQVSQNHADQLAIAQAILEPVVEACDGRFYLLRGTEAHAGKSGEHEETLARALGAVPDDKGLRSRFELFVRVGDGLAHVMHHIGTTGASHYESTAVIKEMVEGFVESGRWGDRAPDVVVRSHRHRHIEVRIPTKIGYGVSFVTAGWQLKTPFTYRVAGGRITTPQIGGHLIRQGDQDLHTRHRVWRLARPTVVEL